MLDTIEKTNAKLRSLPFGAPVEDVMAIIDEDGGIILEGVLSQEVLDEVNEQLDPELEQLHTRLNADGKLAKMFHGELTKRRPTSSPSA